mmetsp:Transcript_42500/g.109270  ORF Transcript_42500/g.109270 Transcript_42500/m.109270 type:complete len:200 (+) Transcript_42500:154-753(+)
MSEGVAQHAIFSREAVVRADQPIYACCERSAFFCHFQPHHSLVIAKERYLSPRGLQLVLEHVYHLIIAADSCIAWRRNFLLSLFNPLPRCRRSRQSPPYSHRGLCRNSPLLIPLLFLPEPFSFPSCVPPILPLSCLFRQLAGENVLKLQPPLQKGIVPVTVGKRRRRFTTMLWRSSALALCCHHPPLQLALHVNQVLEK